MTPRAFRLGEKPAGVITGWTLERKEVSFASVLKNRPFCRLRFHTAVEIFPVLPGEVCCVASCCWVVAD